MFADLNLKVNPRTTTQQTMKECVLTLLKLGFQATAFNCTATTVQEARELQPLRNVDLTSLSTQELMTIAHLKTPQIQSFKQYSRLTVVYDSKDSSFFTSQGARKILSRFDLVAFIPTNEKEFHACCEEGLCDIIQLPVPLTFNLKKNDVSTALARDITFEICYSPALKDLNYRRSLIKDAQFLISRTGGKNLILSSEGQSPIDLRGPYDVINLGFLFSLETASAKRAITVNPENCIIHGQTRKSIGAVLEISPMKDLTYGESKLLMPTPIESGIKPAEAMDEEGPGRTEKSHSKKRRHDLEKK